MTAAQAAGITVLALTDHDTWQGWEEASEAVTATGVMLLRGAELSTIAERMSVHLLSYLHDPHDEALLSETSQARTSRLGRARQMVERINTDYELTWSQVAAHVVEGATVGRPHIADALVTAGHVADRAAAFDTILGKDSPYYVAYYAPTTVQAVAMVRAAGGVPVMAHPRARSRGRTVSIAGIEELVAAGLGGLEVDHRDHSPSDRQELRELAKRHGLFITGGSDYHGSGKPNRLGEHTTAPEVLEEIVAQGRLSLVTT